MFLYNYLMKFNHFTMSSYSLISYRDEINSYWIYVELFYIHKIHKLNSL